MSFYLLENSLNESAKLPISELFDDIFQVKEQSDLTLGFSVEQEVEELEDNKFVSSLPEFSSINLVGEKEKIVLDYPKFSTNIVSKDNLIGIISEEDDLSKSTFSGIGTQVVQNVPPLIQGIDDRFLVTGSTAFGKSVAPIVRLSVPNSKGELSTIGTGVMIGPYSVLTAAHVVDSINVNSINVTPSDPGSNNLSYGSATVNRKIWWDADDTAWDIAVLNLDRNLGDHTDWYSYGYDDDYWLNPFDNWWEDEVFYTAGYPSDLLEGSQLYAESLIIDDTDSFGDVFESETGDGASGQSGSPLWYGDGVVYGVLVGGESQLWNSFDQLEFARITEDKFDAITDAINEDSRPTDKPDFVDYDDWFGTNYSYFQNNVTNSSSQSYTSFSISTGDSFTVRSVVRNNGTAAYDGFYLVPPSIDVSFYASSNTFISTSDYHLGDVTVSSIDPFEWKDAILTANLPNIPTGNYHVGWIVDPDNTLNEFEEGNNKGLLDSFTLDVINNQPLNLIGTSSQDTLDGQGGNDTLYGRGHDDTLSGHHGNDSLFGEDGNDWLYGGDGNDSLFGGYDNDYLFGEDGDDWLYGGPNNDVIYGQEGEDRLYGQEGNDMILGWAGNDELFGMGEDDVLDGYSPFESGASRSAEYDTLKGGTGADTFVIGWNSSNYQGAYYLGAGYATITDFNYLEGDKIKAYRGFSDYSLEYSQLSGTSAEDTLVKYQGDLIAVIEDDTSLDIVLDFDFV